MGISPSWLQVAVAVRPLAFFSGGCRLQSKLFVTTTKTACFVSRHVGELDCAFKLFEELKADGKLDLDEIDP